MDKLSIFQYFQGNNVYFYRKNSLKQECALYIGSRSIGHRSIDLKLSTISSQRVSPLSRVLSFRLNPQQSLYGVN